MSSEPIDWRIRIKRLDAERRYRLEIDYGDDTPAHCRQIDCELPPDFEDLLVAARNAAPERRWRYSPQSLPTVEADDLLFNAGDRTTLQEIGRRLCGALFPEAGGTDLLAELIARRERGVRIGIEIEPGLPLARVPWEAMFSPRGETFLATDIATNVVRLIDPDLPGRDPRPVSGKIKLLIAVANPDLNLDSDREIADIKKRVISETTEQNFAFDVHVIERTSRKSFSDGIQDFKPHIVHFIGHGGFYNEQGVVEFLHNIQATRKVPITANELRGFIQNDPPWVVLLNSCRSGTASLIDSFGGAAHNLARIEIPFVIAMQYKISDEAALAFSDRFYASIADGYPVPDAVSRGRNEIQLGLDDEAYRTELITPVLYMPLNGKFDRIVFAPPDSPIPPAAPAEAPPAPAAEPGPAAAPVSNRKKKAIIVAAMATVGVAVVLALLAWLAGLGSSLGDRSASAPPAPMEARAASRGPAMEAGLSGDRALGASPFPWAPAETGGPDGAPFPPYLVFPAPSPVPMPSPPPAALIPREEMGVEAPGEAGEDGPGSDIILTTGAIRGGFSAELFFGGAALLAGRDRAGVSAEGRVAWRSGRWQAQLGGRADVFPAKSGSSKRLEAEARGEVLLGDARYAAVSAAYRRQDSTGLLDRLEAGPSLGIVGSGWRLEAGPVVRRSEWASGASRSELAGRVRGEIAVPLDDGIEARAGATVTAGRSTSMSANATVEFRITDDLSAEAGIDFDLETDREAARDSAVTSRAGLRYRF